MTREPVTAYPDACGLYRGVPAVAFALQAAEQPAYASGLRTLDNHIATLTQHRLERAHERIDRGRLPTLREFDLVSGLTGIGVYLQHQHGVDNLLRDGPVLPGTPRRTPDGETLPGWWSGNGPDSQTSPHWSGGHANLGMAHGIAGPLALLSTAMKRGTTVTGQADAIGRICTWLDQWRSGTRSRPWWPGMISLAEWRDRTVHQPGPQRRHGATEPAATAPPASRWDACLLLDG